MKLRLLLPISIAFFSVFAACKKNDTPPAPEPVQTVTTISPSGGPKNTIVTINGKNFGSNSSAVKVYFNNLQANIQTVTDTMITVAVPANAGTGNVKVEKNSVQATGPSFTYWGNLYTGTPVFTGSGNSFINPTGIAKDAAGNMFICERGAHRIVKITPTGVASVFAGGIAGYADGTGINARFNQPHGIVIDPAGNLYVTDRMNHAIRKITPAGVVSTLAGNGTLGFANGTGTAARFNEPFGITLDPSGNLFVADYTYNFLRKITPAGVVTAPLSPMGGVYGVVSDASGNIFYTSNYGHQVRKYNPATGTDTEIAGLINTSGNTDGTSTTARFNQPTGITIDAAGNLYVADFANHTIRKITPAGVVTTIGGKGSAGIQDGTSADAWFNFPIGLMADPTNGSIYIADFGNGNIRQLIIE